MHPGNMLWFSWFTYHEYLFASFIVFVGCTKHWC